MSAGDDRKAYLSNIARIAQSFGWVPIGISGKIPRFRDWQTVRIDPADPDKRVRHIQHLYDVKLANNVGVLTGKASGIVVLDIDKGSVEWFRQLVDVNQPLPETFTVRTGNDGLHIYFRYTEDLADIGNMNKIFGQNIDYRTDGGVAVSPGAIHPVTKKPYLVRSGYVDGQPIIANMPVWLVSFLKANQERRASKR